jgi:addiction module HigA family antidote
MFINGMRPVHPAEVLYEEYLKPLDMAANALAKALKLTPARVNEIVRQERGITPDTAMRLARYFGTTPEFWLDLQMTYELRRAAQQEWDLIVEEVKPLEMAA